MKFLIWFTQIQLPSKYSENKHFRLEVFEFTEVLSVMLMKILYNLIYGRLL